MIFLELFYNFFIIGLFTIGGGYAMLPLIQQKVVFEHNWISDRLFTDIVAMSQMTPGPIGINSATYIGYNVVKQCGYNEFLCVCGSFTTTLAVVLPSFLIVLWLCRIYSRFNDFGLFKNFMKGLRPAVAGLIGAAALLLMTPETFPDWKSIMISVAAFVAAMWLKANPMLVLLAAGAIGIILF